MSFVFFDRADWFELHAVDLPSCLEDLESLCLAEPDGLGDFAGSEDEWGFMMTLNSYQKSCVDEVERCVGQILTVF